MLDETSRLGETIPPDQLSGLIYSLYKLADGSFLVRLFSEGELELILRKLPPEIAMAHREKDDFIVEYLAKTIPALRNMDTQLFSAALRGFLLQCFIKMKSAGTYSTKL